MLSSVRLAAVLALSGVIYGAPLRVGVIGLVHGHAAGFLGGSALVPAGGAMHRSDIEIVGVVEPDQQVYTRYAARFHWPPAMRFGSIAEMAARAHPEAVLVFTSTSGHTAVVQECARLGIHVMMEKPLAVSYSNALAMADAARKGKIHVLVDYETSWYASNHAAHDLLAQGELGTIVKTVFRDGHSGPQRIHVQPEFFSWLTNPKLNGAGALYDFGCYGADLMTWLMNGETPVSVLALTKHLQPQVYPRVDDEADVILNYSKAVSILQASWNWPFNVKETDLYGATGYAKALDSERLEVRRASDHTVQSYPPPALEPPYDDPLHYLAAVVRGEISENGSLSSLKTNVVVSEILDAARRSAANGEAVKLPLE
jgi:glucose-fructose oxidoreductase